VTRGKVSSGILVVGATGHLGTRLVRQLAAAGSRPYALVRSREKGKLIEEFASPLIGDLRDPATLTEPFRRAERVFIVAPPVPEMETIERNAIDAAVRAGAKRIVYLSNFAAKEGSEMRPVHVHGLHERLVASKGIDWTVLGPTRYMTSLPFDWRSVLQEGVLLEAGGSGIMTCIDPDDVAEIAVKALTQDGHDGKTYRLTSEDAFTGATLAAFLADFLGREVRTFDGDPAGVPMAGYFRLVSAGVYKTTETVAHLLGRRPRTYAEWLRRNPPVAS
jgi:uncharacterized protein YbjT (DUF2867 family)